VISNRQAKSRLTYTHDHLPTYQHKHNNRNVVLRVTATYTSNITSWSMSPRGRRHLVVDVTSWSTSPRGRCHLVVEITSW